MRDGYEMAIGWQAVARMMQYRAVREAAEAREILMYVQAVDVSKFVLPDSEYERMLRVVNMNDTGKLLPMLPLYVGMRVRFTMKLSAKHRVVQDAVGRVAGVEFHTREFDLPGSDWRDDRSHSAYECGYVRLRYMPRAVLVCVDGLHEDVGYGKGIVMVHVHKAPWEYKTHHVVDGERKPWVLHVQRYQFPLAPEKVRTVQTAQGLGMDGACMHLAKPPGNMKAEEWWLHLYVMLSRVRVEKRIVVYDLPPKQVFEQGPPEFVRQGLQRFEELMQRVTLENVRRARARLGWPAATGARRAAEAPFAAAAGSVPSQTGSGEQGERKAVQQVATSSFPAPAQGRLLDTASSKAKGQVATAPPGPARRADHFDDPDGDDFSGRCEDDDLQFDLAALAPRSVVSEEFEALGAGAEASATSSGGRLQSSVGGAKRSGGGGGGAEEGSGREGRGGSPAAPRPEAPLPPPPGSPPAASAAAGSRQSLVSFAMTPTAPVSDEQLRFLEPPEVDLAHLLYGIERSALARSVWVTSDERPVGLTNAGKNLCFVNAVLQLLFRIQPFRMIVLKHDHAGGDVWRCEACALKAQFEAMLRVAEEDGGGLGVEQAALSVRKGAFGNVFKGNCVTGAGRQCDATEFMQRAMGVNDGFEHDRLCDLLGVGHPDLAFRATVVTACRSVLLDSVWGIVSRSRFRCLHCARVSDSLTLEACLDLDLATNSAGSLCHLVALRKREAEVRLRCEGCATLRCVQCWYIEKEPPLLVFRLKRGWRRGTREGKDAREISFPEVLHGMRSGPYRLAGVLRHNGPRASGGHYTSHAWVGGDRYVCFNDEECTTHAFAELATRKARQEAYALFYVREKYHSDDVGDGTENTPWARDAASRELCGRYFRGEFRNSSSHSASSAPRGGDAAASSASSAVGAVHGDAGLRACGSVARPEDARQGEAVAAGDARGESSEPRSSAALDVASSSCVAPASSSGDSLGGLGVGCASTSGSVRDVGDDAKGAPPRSGGESSSAGFTGTSGAAAVPRMSEDRRGAPTVDVEPEWRQYTPRNVDESKCLARIWAGGCGGQCSKAPTVRQYCKRHAQQENQKGWHGNVQGEIPEEKLREFRKRARVEIP